VNAEIQNTKFYIIDDDPSVRRALKRLLRTMATEVETFASAEEFLKSFISNQPVCLILDVYLGGMSGIELYRYLIQLGHRIPTVFVTAQDTESIREEVEKLSGVKLLRKPFDDESLFNAIQEVITNP
jgi:FixJ family two-component response regulator